MSHTTSSNAEVSGVPFSHTFRFEITSARPFRLGAAWVGLLFTVALTLFAEALVYPHFSTWTLGVVAMAALAVLEWRKPCPTRSTAEWLAAGAVLWCGAWLAWRGGPLHAWLTALSLFAACLVSVEGRRRAIRLVPAAACFLPGALRAPFIVFRRWRRIRRAPGSQHSHNEQTSARRRTIRMLRAWATPAAVVAVFAMLLGQANPFFERLLWDFETVMEYLGPGRWIYRGLFFAVLLAVVTPRLGWWGAVRTRPASPRRLLATLGREDTALKTLWLVNILFAVHNALDVMVLLGGAGLPEGMTFAEYAHRGAYPLLATATLAGVMALVFLGDDDASASASASTSPWVRRLVAVWVLQNLVLTAFAIQRTVLYVEAYNLTVFRLAALTWMGLTAFALTTVFLCARRGWPRSKLVGMNAAALTCFLLTTPMMNWEGFVARYNVAHCKEVAGSGPPLDTWHLRQLGPAAIPALTQALPHLATNTSPWRTKIAVQYRTDLLQTLRREQANWKEATGEGWRLLSRHDPWRVHGQRGPTPTVSHEFWWGRP